MTRHLATFKNTSFSLAFPPNINSSCHICYTRAHVTRQVALWFSTYLKPSTRDDQHLCARYNGHLSINTHRLVTGSTHRAFSVPGCFASYLLHLIDNLTSKHNRLILLSLSKFKRVIVPLYRVHQSIYSLNLYTPERQ